MSAPRQRTDRLLVERGLFESRTKAQAAIEAGLVIADDRLVRKASEEIADRLRHYMRAPRIPMCHAAASSSRPRSTISVSTQKGASVLTSAPRPADLPKSCSSAGQGASMRSTSDMANCTNPCGCGPKSLRWKRPISAAFPPPVGRSAGFCHCRRQLHLAQERAAAGARARQRTCSACCIDQAAIRGRPRRVEKGHCARPAVHAAVCNDIEEFVASLGWRVLETIASPIKAATETSNSCLEPCVTEQLTISRLGHRGDGIAETPEGAVYVPYTLPGETVTVEPRRRASRPPASAACRQTQPRARCSRSANISAPAAAARCSTGRSPSTIFGNVRLSPRPWRRPALSRRSPT